MAWLVHNEWMTECHEGVRHKREKTYQNLNILYLLKKNADERQREKSCFN